MASLPAEPETKPGVDLERLNALRSRQCAILEQLGKLRQDQKELSAPVTSPGPVWRTAPLYAHVRISSNLRSRSRVEAILVLLTLLDQTLQDAFKYTDGDSVMSLSSTHLNGHVLFHLNVSNRGMLLVPNRTNTICRVTKTPACMSPFHSFMKEAEQCDMVWPPRRASLQQLFADGAIPWWHWAASWSFLAAMEGPALIDEWLMSSSMMCPAGQCASCLSLVCYAPVTVRGFLSTVFFKLS